MKIRAQIAKVFHLDKCIGCHTCSLACKNIWTDRKGTEYMWWNNVETKPGTGYPTLYEDQRKYRGGWEPTGDGKLRLALGGRISELANIFYNPRLPTLDDYYHPWNYTFGDLTDADPAPDQPVARPVSSVTGQEMSVEFGPLWDDDLSGSNVYAAADPALQSLTPEERRHFFEFERLVFFYIPRICNHCLNPGCLGACPAGAIYKRGEDGIVLIGQDKCRAWRMCVSGCPYKKSYFNWDAGKAEKCILCYPRQEEGLVPACAHSCVGRIRYLGALLYDADRVVETASVPDDQLVEAHRAIIQDPNDPEIARLAKENGVNDDMIDAARKSPVYQWVKVWKLALPHHPEWRTLPMMFYVPPTLPVLAAIKNGGYEPGKQFFGTMAAARLPMRYMAWLFTAGNEAEIMTVFRKLDAVRMYKRSATVGDIDEQELERTMNEAKTTPQELEAIYRMTAFAPYDERFVVPPMSRTTSKEGA